MRASVVPDDPAVDGVDDEESAGGGPGALLVQGTEERAAGEFEGGVGQPGLDQGACLGPLPRYGGGRGPEDSALLVGLDGDLRAEEADDSGAGEGEQLAQPGSGRS